MFTKIKENKVAISNYGNTIRKMAELGRVEDGALPIGAGLSYGDCSISELVSKNYLPRIFIDNNNEEATCTPAVTIRSLLIEALRLKLVPVVMPGTSSVTIGGAIASNVHGKSQAEDGSFCDHVSSITIKLRSGEIVSASREENSQIFEATCGGLGMTGEILSATIKLKRISYNSVLVTKKSTSNLSETLSALKEDKSSVAWIDTSVSRAEKIGRGTVYLSKEGKQDIDMDFKQIKYPFGKKMAVFGNRQNILLSKIKYHLDRSGWFNDKKEKPMNRYLFPLDRIEGFNDAYGENGFYQFQCFLEESGAYNDIIRILNEAKKRGINPFLVTIKRMRESSTGNLTFSGNGYTIALDFISSAKSRDLIKELNKYVVARKGKIYPAKDMFVNKKQFKEMYQKGYSDQRLALLKIGPAICSRQTARYGFDIPE